jgi:nitrogen fixation protein FixH
MTTLRSLVRTGSFWAFVPAGLLTLLIGIQLVLVRRALSDPSVAVEDDYYRKALAWDARRAEALADARLGWQLAADLLSVGADGADVRVVLRDRAGAPVEGARLEVEAFAVARANRVVRATFTETAGGEYRARLPVDRFGLWELSFRAARGGDHFTADLREDLGKTVRR